VIDAILSAHYLSSAKNSTMKRGGGKQSHKKDRSSMNLRSSQSKIPAKTPASNQAHCVDDVCDIQATIMSRLNQRLKEANVFGGGGGGGGSSNSVSGDSAPKLDSMMTMLLQHILPIVIESIATAVGEVVRNALKPVKLQHSDNEQVLFVTSFCGLITV
jgi:hypothetical protein